MSSNCNKKTAEQQQENDNDLSNDSDSSTTSLSSSSSSTTSQCSSSSSSPSSSSDGSSSSSELSPRDALQSPLTGLLNFEGFSMPQIRNFGISNIDMSNLPSLRNLRSFNMPRFQPTLPNLANNLRMNLANLQTFTPNMPNFPNLSYLSQLTNVNTSAELQNLFNLFRISTNLPNLPNLPNLANLPNLPNLSNLPNLPNLANLPNMPQFPQLPQLPRVPQLSPFFFGQYSRNQLVKPWTQMKDSVRNMHRRLNDITQHFPNHFHFHEWKAPNGTEYIRIYFLLNDFIYYCDSRMSNINQALANNTKKHNKNNNNKNNGFKKNNTNIKTKSNHNHAKNNINNTNDNNNNNNHHHHHHHRHYHHHQHEQQQQQQHNQAVPSTSSGSQRQQSSSSGRHGNLKHEILNSQPLYPINFLDSDSDRVDYYDYYDAKNCRFIFSIGVNLYYFDDVPSVESINRPSPIKIQTSCPYAKTDFKICPSDADLIAYHCRGDIWVVNIRTSQELKLTDLNKLIASTSTATNGDQTHSNGYPLPNYLMGVVGVDNIDGLPYLIGKPSHIIREEFRRHQGFWWQPSEKHKMSDHREEYTEFRILYEETDQSQVGPVLISSWDGAFEFQRFPQPGKKNPASRLKIVKFKMSTRGSTMYDPVIADVLPNLQDLYPECEYLVRVGWLRHDVIWCQMLNRRQTHLVMAILSLSDSFESQIIYEENNDMYWVSAHDILYFLNLSSKLESKPLCEGSELAFIWSSEESGFRHLYFVKVKLGTKQTSPKIVLKKQLTEGTWEINEKDLWVDEEDKLIYFCGLRDTPLEKHLYVLNYADCLDDTRHSNQHSKNKVHRLTELNFTQSNIAFNAKRSIFVNIQSNLSVPPFGFVNRIIPHPKHRRDPLRRLPNSSRLALLLVNSFIYNTYEPSQMENMKFMMKKPSITYDCQADLLPGLGKPELFCCQLTSGELIYGSIFKPEFMESGVRYPTVLEIYGGPEIQMVSNNFMSLRQPTRHLLCSEGYVVVLIDCRGSGRRGLGFEAHSFHRMGQVELADQIEVLQWLAKNTGYIDLTRIAIKGWSYGGYMALMAIAQFPDLFKVAIAGAPVTNWLTYDSAYTERFMGLPDENQDGYYKGNVLNYVHHFPDEANRLLILHGMMDENVHFSHTVTLVKALIEAGKPYDLQVFPNERHILKSSASRENYITSVLSYLQLNL